MNKFDIIKNIALFITNSLGSFFRKFRFLFSYIIVLLIFLLVAPGLLYFSVGIFSSDGEIYVGSPSVYTRERLVNDRNEQDRWLKQQLSNFDNHIVLPSLYETSRSGIAGHIPRAEGQSDVNQGNEKNSIDLPGQDFKQESTSLDYRDMFLYNNNIRNVIRQKLVSNSLDDRHDLTGNSLYGLKFDTTVIFRNIMQRGARVDVRVTPTILSNSFWRRSEGDKDKSFEGARLARFVTKIDGAGSGGKDNDSIATKFSAGLKKLYVKWTKSIESRFNTKIRNNCAATDKLEMAAISEDIFNVKHIGFSPVDKESSDGLFYNTLDIGGVWNSYINVIIRTRSKIVSLPYKASDHEVEDKPNPVNNITCDSIFDVIVSEVWQIYRVIDVSESEITQNQSSTLEDEAIAGQYREVVLGEKKYKVIRECGNLDIIDDEGILNSIVEAVLNRKKPLYPCKKTQPKDSKPGFSENDNFEKNNKKCFAVPVSVGLYTFLGKLQYFDQYAYSVFPKFSSVIHRTDETSAVDIGFLGNWFTSLDVTTASNRQQTGLNRNSSSYLNSSDRDSSQFGWVISRGRSEDQLETSQFILVSIPAWVDELQLVI